MFGATTLYGISRAQKIKDEIAQMEWLLLIYQMIQSEMRYTHDYLGEIFKDMSTRLVTPYGEWMKELSQELKSQKRDSFANVWERCTRKHLPEDTFPREIYEDLLLIGVRLGGADLISSLQALDRNMEKLQIHLRTKREQSKEQMKLCYYLGVTSGLFLVILLL